VKVQVHQRELTHEQITELRALFVAHLPQ